MVYRDSTADGVEGSMLEGGGNPASDFQLEAESHRLMIVPVRVDASDGELVLVRAQEPVAASAG